jgi:hypothetical protein
MNSDQFFGYLRRADVPQFGTTLSVRQVGGMMALLDAAKGLPLHHVANILAQVYRETGGGMYPIKETVMPWHKNKNPSDAEVIRRLDREWAKPDRGGLRHVREPYWRDGWFGRGQIQITHRANYLRFGISNPEDAMKLDVSARVAVQGMRDGMFTRRKLADYDFPDALDNPPTRNPRRIVNGPDGSDAEVAGHHRTFAAALVHASYAPVASRPVTSNPVVVNETAFRARQNPVVNRQPAPRENPIAALFAAFAALFKKNDK